MVAAACDGAACTSQWRVNDVNGGSVCHEDDDVFTVARRGDEDNVGGGGGGTSRKRKRSKLKLSSLPRLPSLEESTMNNDAHWEKVLWRRQPWPDTYSGGEARFLAELRRNVWVVLYTWSEGARAGAHLMAHVDVVILTFLLFEAIQTQLITLRALILASAALVSITYAAYVGVLRDETLPSVDYRDHACTLLTIAALGYSLIPIIRTLTTTISTDTIYALSIGAATVGCAFHDYGAPLPTVSPPLSLSAGLSSSVLLISRLKDNPPAFTFLSLSFFAHAYLAPVRNRINAAHPDLMLALSATIAACSLSCLYLISPFYALTCGAVHVFCVLLAPSYLVRLQQRKRTIHGPWDEAVLSHRRV